MREEERGILPNYTCTESGEDSESPKFERRLFLCLPVHSLYGIAQRVYEVAQLTVRARSPSSCFITAEKLLLVMSKNSQHLLIDWRSHPDVGCSLRALISRFCL